MSFNGITAYGDLLPSSQYSDILLNAFYLQQPDYDGELYMIRNGERSYLLFYNLTQNFETMTGYADYIQYSSPNNYNHYTLEYGDGRLVSLIDWVPQYIYQGTDNVLGGNVILMEGYSNHIIQDKLYKSSVSSSIMISAVLLLTFFINFFKKVFK